MNKLAIGGIIAVVVVGAIAVYLINRMEQETQADLVNNDPGNTISRPAVKPVPNTFSIMTPEEKAAADDAAHLKAEQDALASSTASTTASSSDTEIEVDTETEVQL